MSMLGLCEKGACTNRFCTISKDLVSSHNAFTQRQGSKSITRCFNICC